MNRTPETVVTKEGDRIRFVRGGVTRAMIASAIRHWADERGDDVARLFTQEIDGKLHLFAKLTRLGVRQKVDLSRIRLSIRFDVSTPAE